MTEQTALQKISTYMNADIIKERFREVVGGGSGAFIGSVITAVANSDALQKCQADSIYISALRAATMRLSVDPSTGQAHLVPYNGRATLIVGYKGLYDMAVRTGKYRYINVSPIYEGERVEEDKITGWHSFIAGEKINKENVIGWLGSFEMYPERGSGQTRGLIKTMYMTVEEIHEHANKYSPSYNNPSGAWRKETRKMERKTVLRLMLRRWGYLDPVDVKALEEAESDPETVGADVYDLPPELHERGDKPEEQLLAELGYPPEEKPPKQTNPKIEWSQDQINALVMPKLAKNDFGARGMLGLSNLTSGASLELISEWGRQYRSIRPIEPTKDSPTSQEAATFANDWYTQYKESVK